MKQQKVELDLKTSEQSLNQCKRAESQAQVTLASKARELATCEASLGTTFLVVAIEWNLAGNYDVDLHVSDPGGNKFFWGKNNRDRRDFPSTEAQISYDNTRGPGVELWQHPKAQAGTYIVSYDYYGAPANNRPIEVKGNVFYRNGRLGLPTVTLTETHKLRPIARLVVGSGGNVEVRNEP
jgi:hypothetical protein